MITASPLGTNNESSYTWLALGSRVETSSDSDSDSDPEGLLSRHPIIFDEPLSYLNEEEMNLGSTIRALKMGDSIVKIPYGSDDHDMGLSISSPIGMDSPLDYQGTLSGEGYGNMRVSYKRRKALLIGIKYYRRRNSQIKVLRGPHHDVMEIKKLLQGFYGWNSDCFKILKDDNSGPENQPTLANIKREIQELVRDAQSGDHLFFYFSGHGGQVPDQNGDEEDGMDEVIMTSDEKFLVDDDLHDLLIKPLPLGCHLTALMDCCSSGTGLDLPFDPVTRKAAKVRKQSEGNVVLISACEDSERAFEKKDDEDYYKRVRGMLTLAFINSLKKRKVPTYDDVLNDVRNHLKRRNTIQTPQLSSSYMIRMDDLLTL